MNTNQFDRMINNAVRDFSNAHYELFRSISGAVVFLIDSLTLILSSVNPYVFVLLFIGLTYFISRKAIKSVALGLLLLGIYFIGYWQLMMLTLSLVLISILISMLLGIPVGILMSESSLMTSIITPILDFMQTVPTFVYLIPSVMLFGLGKASALFAMLIYSLPSIIRLTALGLRLVDKDVIEATITYGATRWQLLTITKIPLALKSIFLGINQTSVASLSMVVTASMIGAGGLGGEILRSINQINLGQGIRSGICIVILAIVINNLNHEISNKFNY